jgi:outer membrane receptor for ferrienterochelin and colicins
MRLYILLAGVFLVVAGGASAQQTGAIRGIVKNRTTQEALPGANVALVGTLRGASTNAAGEFSIDRVPEGTYSISVSLVGYQRETRRDVVVRSGQITPVSVDLQPVPIEAEPVVVTASKREQSLQDVPVSVSVMDARGISQRNFTTVEDAMRYIPGVNMTEFQVNIRGSSGYSRGAGSRVLMLVDGIPFLTGDTGELNFETLPIGQVDRIEVVKGASSALYGSSALGGVINVLTKPIPSKPVTTVRTYGGFYGSPSYASWDWKGGTRMVDGEYLSHSFKVDELGVLLYGSRTADDGYRQNDYRRRYNGYLKLHYDLSSVDAFTTSFSLLDQKRGSFLYWRNLDSALIPPATQLGDEVSSTRYFFSGNFTSIVSSSFIYSIKGMWFHNKWDDTIDTLTNNSRSDVYRVELQGTWSPNASQVVTFGVEGNLDRVTADLFGNRKGGGGAVYAQDELQITDELKAALGARFDFQDLDSLGSNSQFNPKAGLVYVPREGTTLRASFGRGFRTPAVAEAFITTQAGGLVVIPNPSLKPEKSYSVEVGGSQFIGDAAMADLAFFHSDFDDLIEPAFATGLTATFQNLTRARIQGLEALLKLGLLDKGLLVDVGYTYISPTDRTTGETLKYRPRHMLYVNATASAGMFSFGADFRYLSRVEMIDDEFVTLGIVKDGQERVAIYVTDVRLGAELTRLGFPLAAVLNVKNIFQYNYVELIGNIAPPRQFVLTLEAKL